MIEGREAAEGIKEAVRVQFGRTAATTEPEPRFNLKRVILIGRR